MSFQDVCDLGGADGPFEMISAYVGGVMPGGATDAVGNPADAGEVAWRQLRAWQAICHFWRYAFLQYNRML